MPTGSGYKYAKVWARVKIQGFGVVEATSINVTYGINKLPTASVSIAVGKAVGKGASDSPDIYDIQTYRREIQIDVKVGDSMATLFKGYIARLSSVKGNGRFGVAISAIGWQSDLATGSPFATGLSRNAALYDIEMPVALKTLMGEQEGAGKASLDGMINTVEGILSANTYGDALLTVAKSLTSTTTAGTHVNNAAAAAVLDATTALLTFKTGAPASAIAGIANTMAYSMYSTYNGKTLWEALLLNNVELSYVVVPTVDKIFIVPWVPIASTPDVMLDSTRIISIKNNFNIGRVVQTLSLYQQETMGTLDNYAGTTMIRASYTNPNVASGMLDIAPLPSWLTSLISSQATGKTMSLKAGIRGRSPQSAAQKEQVANGESVANISDEVVIDAKTLGGAAKNYARFLYGLRAITGTAIIQTPLDSSIGPATTVRFDLGNKMGLLDGYVDSVTYVIDSERHLAVQRLTVAHTRSPADSSAIGTPSSPIWQGAVGGVDVIGNTADVTG